MPVKHCRGEGAQGSDLDPQTGQVLFSLSLQRSADGKCQSNGQNPFVFPCGCHICSISQAGEVSWPGVALSHGPHAGSVQGAGASRACLRRLLLPPLSSSSSSSSSSSFAYFRKHLYKQMNQKGLGERSKPRVRLFSAWAKIRACIEPSSDETSSDLRRSIGRPS